MALGPVARRPSAAPRKRSPPPARWKSPRNKQSAARLAAMNAEIAGEQAEEGHSLSETFRESDEEWRARMAEGQKKLDANSPGFPPVGKTPPPQARENRRRPRTGAQAAPGGSRRTRPRLRSRPEQVKAAIEAETDARHSTTWRNPGGTTSCHVRATRCRLENHSRATFPRMDAGGLRHMEPPAEAPPAVRIGHIEVDRRQTRRRAARRSHGFALPDARRTGRAVRARRFRTKVRS